MWKVISSKLRSSFLSNILVSFKAGSMFRIWTINQLQVRDFYLSTVTSASASQLLIRLNPSAKKLAHWRCGDVLGYSTVMWFLIRDERSVCYFIEIIWNEVICPTNFNSIHKWILLTTVGAPHPILPNGRREYIFFPRPGSRNIQALRRYPPGACKEYRLKMNMFKNVFR